MLLAILLTIPAAAQEVRVIYPSAAEIADARLPVPAVVMTRAEANTLSDRALAERLIGHVPHRPIIKVARQRTDPAPMWAGANALSGITFVEQGTPLRGRLCRSRSIAVSFDTIDGRAEPSSLATPAEARPRRVFAVTQSRLVGVVPRGATEESCRHANFAGSGRADFAEVVGLIERLVALSDGKDGGLLLDGCFDAYAGESARCDPRATLRGLDWSRLSVISRSSFTGEPVRWSITIGQDARRWTIVVEESGAGPRVAVRRDYPAPF